MLAKVHLKDGSVNAKPVAGSARLSSPFRGLQGEEHSVCQDLADVLGGAVGGTAPQSMPGVALRHQTPTGKTVKPILFCVGIYGRAASSGIRPKISYIKQTLRADLPVSDFGVVGDCSK